MEKQLCKLNCSYGKVSHALNLTFYLLPLISKVSKPVTPGVLFSSSLGKFFACNSWLCPLLNMWVKKRQKNKFVCENFSSELENRTPVPIKMKIKCIFSSWICAPLRLYPWSFPTQAQKAEAPTLASLFKTRWRVFHLFRHRWFSRKRVLQNQRRRNDWPRGF